MLTAASTGVYHCHAPPIFNQSAFSIELNSIVMLQRFLSGIA